MSNNRPKIKVPFETADYVMEFISIAVLLIMWGLVITQIGTLPEEVPSHFGANGKPDDYNSKMTLWLLPIIATATYIGLFIINRYPHIHNYRVNITEDNALVQYRFSTRIVRIINLFCALTFGYLVYQLIEVAQGEANGLGQLFLYIVLGGSFMIPIILLILQNRLNKKHG
ncbi:DUF1648 domain-containing protein [Winogradskyella maritima]|uniref:DUF1648 domain-containing protein n=1 Tax=Winogradskyella maritima TaxID=1517766 RepID=A0ABV8AKM1_9FLAO|nr:DUF1648 domain-containing protein [Winogradskyella maritima]